METKKIFQEIAGLAGFAVLLLILSFGCSDKKSITAPPVGTLFSTNLSDIYDASMIFGTPIPSRSYGQGTFLFAKDELALSFDVSFNFFFKGDFGGAKFYLSPMRPSGQTVRTIQPAEVTGNRIRGVWANTDSEPLTPALVDSLFAGSVFIEIVAKDSTGLDIGKLLLKP